MYLTALLRAKRRNATSLIMRALDAGTDVRDIYLRVFQSAQYEVGRLWQMNKITAAQEHYCTAVTQSIISKLYPHIFSAERNGHQLVASCAFAEQHEIGIRMVCDFFEMEGWDTHYLGAGTEPESVVRAIIEKRAELALVSVTVGLHLTRAKALINLIRSSEACQGVKVLVGGYIFNALPDLWRKMGADGYARDAREAVAVARKLFESRSSAAGAANQTL
jgi:methanogenic corrinoid protein MtbC1